MFLIVLNEFPCQAQCQRKCNLVSVPLYFSFFWNAPTQMELSLYSFFLSRFSVCILFDCCGIYFWHSLSFVPFQCSEQTLANAVTEMQKSVKYTEEFKHLQISVNAVWNPLLVYIVLCGLGFGQSGGAT